MAEERRGIFVGDTAMPKAYREVHVEKGTATPKAPVQTQPASTPPVPTVQQYKPSASPKKD